jgi:hypothetical protein
MLIDAFHPVFIARLESPSRLPRLVDFIPVPQPHEQPSTDILRDPKIPREQNHHTDEIMHKVLIKQLARRVPTPRATHRVSHPHHRPSRPSHTYATIGAALHPSSNITANGCFCVSGAISTARIASASGTTHASSPRIHETHPATHPRTTPNVRIHYHTPPQKRRMSE